MTGVRTPRTVLYMNTKTPRRVEGHEITWWVYAGSERIRKTSKMRGAWGHDATCSCGWDSRTGGATRRSVERDVRWHKYEESNDWRML